jgi:4-coumarate--CoA ligase
MSLTSELYRATVEEAAAMAGSCVRGIAYVEDASSFAHARATDKPLRPDNRPIDSREDIVALPYSSGTTGKPKGVCLTHQNLVANIQQCTLDGECNIGICPDSRLVAILPFFHIYGLTVLMCVALAERASLVTMPRFEPTAFLQTLQNHAITQAFVAPPICVFLSKHPMVAAYDLSALREIFSGAAPLDAGMQVSLGEQLNVTVRQGYGMTEASPIISIAPAEAKAIIPGSAGLLVPNSAMKVLGQDDVVLEPGEEGELCISGPQVMRGYLNRPDATRQAFTADGFLRTGDLARISEDGNIFIGAQT